MRHQRNTAARQSPIHDTFASWLAEQSRGALTRLQLATGLSYTLLQKVKRGESVSLDCAAKLAEHTGLPLGAFTSSAPEWLRGVRP